MESRINCTARLSFMDKKRLLATAVAFLILAGLIYLQYRHWRSFDWPTFWNQTHHIKKWHVVHAILLIYLGYALIRPEKF